VGSPSIAAVAPEIPARPRVARGLGRLRVEHDDAIGARPAIVARIPDEIVVNALAALRIGNVQAARLGAAGVGDVDVADAAQTGSRPGLEELGLVEGVQAAGVVRVDWLGAEVVGIEVVEQKLGGVLPTRDHEGGAYSAQSRSANRLSPAKLSTGMP
jgi:hypothetical protein